MKARSATQGELGSTGPWVRVIRRLFAEDRTFDESMPFQRCVGPFCRDAINYDISTTMADASGEENTFRSGTSPYATCDDCGAIYKEVIAPEDD